MSNYSKTVDFGAKDALATGDPSKVVSGTEIDDEFDNISTAVATKANKKLPATTGNIATLDASGDLGDSGVKFSGAGGTVTADISELNTLDGVTATTAEINLLDGVTATTAEINIVDGITATTAEINILDSDVGGSLPTNVEVSVSSIEDITSITTHYHYVPQRMEWTHGTLSYQKQAEFKVARAGTLSTTFTLATDNGSYTVYGRIYVNGVAVGTERGSSSTAGLTFAEDITVSAGDLVQIYSKVTTGGVFVTVSDYGIGFNEAVDIIGSDY